VRRVVTASDRTDTGVDQQYWERIVRSRPVSVIGSYAPPRMLFVEHAIGCNTLSADSNQGAAA
jgi:hypothetical protein